MRRQVAALLAAAVVVSCESGPVGPVEEAAGPEETAAIPAKLHPEPQLDVRAAHAGMAMANEHAAEVLHKGSFGCASFDIVAPQVLGRDGRVTILPSGKRQLTCHWQLDDEDPHPDRAIVLTSRDYPEYVCIIHGEPAYTWREVRTPSGRVTLTCRI